MVILGLLLVAWLNHQADEPRFIRNGNHYLCRKACTRKEPLQGFMMNNQNSNPPIYDIAIRHGFTRA